MADATSALEAMAFRGPAHRVHVRIAPHADRVYLDLADASWRVIEISTTGWRLVCDPPVRFRRPKALLPLPVPVPGGSLSALRPFVNASEDDFVLVVAMLVAMLRGQGPYPAHYCPVIARANLCNELIPRGIRAISHRNDIF